MRDNFNSLINQNYKKYYECISTQQYSSIISIMSPTIPFNLSELDMNIIID